MSGRFYHEDEDFLGEGYPYTDYDEARYRRNPYEERSLWDVDRESDPYASPRMERRSRREDYRDPAPLITLRGSPREMQRELGRPWLAPEDRRGPFDQILRGSETPPPGPRATRRRVTPFQDMFGDLDRPVRGAGEQYDRGVSPPRDPFMTREDEYERRPYGGGRAPRDPFRLGGDLYNYEQERGHRHRSLEPPDGTGFDDQARRRDAHYRNRLGEPWGLAEYHGYRGRHLHEQSVFRGRERDERRRHRREEEEEQVEEDPYVFEGDQFGGDFTLFD